MLLPVLRLSSKRMPSPKFPVIVLKEILLLSAAPLIDIAPVNPSELALFRM